MPRASKSKPQSEPDVAEALRASELRYRRLFESAKDGILILDAETGQVVDVNPFLIDLLGLSRADVLGKALWELGCFHDIAANADKFAELQEKEYVRYENLPLQAADGQVREVEFVSNVYLAEGKRVIQCNIRDITERVAMATRHTLAVDELNTRLAAAVSAGNVGLWDYYPQEGRAHFSDEWKRQLGYAPDEVEDSAEEWSSRLHPEDRERTVDYLAQYLAGGGKGEYRIESRLKHKDETYRWILAQGRAVAREGSVVTRMLGCHVDITERKLAEENLHRFAWLLEKEQGETSAPDTPGYGDVTELNTERIILDTVGAETLSNLISDPMDLLDTSVAVYERNGDYAAGKFVSVWCGMMDGASRALCGTDDNRDALHCGKWLCHEDCWNNSAKAAMDSGEPTDIECVGGIRLYAVPVMVDDEAIGIVNIGYGDPPLDEANQRALAAIYEVDVSVLRRAAQAYKPRPQFIIDIAKRRVRSIARAIAEIIKLKRAQENIERLARFPEENPNPVFRVARDGTVTYANEASRVLLEAITTEHGTLLPEWQDRIAAVLADGKTENTEARTDTRTFVTTLTPVTQHGYVNIYARDVTEQLTAEAQLRQSQKLESIGTLAGGVAHDFNNLLMGVMNYVELCRDAIEPDHPIREWLDEITADAQRSANLTRQLLAFARKQTIAPKVLDLNEAIAGMLKLLRRLIGEDTELAWRPGLDPWPLKLDPSQVDQILANLCVNARDAIGGVGEITIETGNATLDAAYCANHADFAPGDYVVLAVSDDGCGMDTETREHIFEPFFTTKEVGRGTGLGLATVYGIVRQNKGFVNVYSEPGKGTTFRIYLPRFRGAIADATETETAAPRPGGNETILLVEDEKSIRVTAALFLEALGYTVLTADCPEEALRLAAESATRIQLLITDVVMPGMSGRDLAERLHELCPQVECLYMSGYTADIIAQRGILDEGVNFLSKPFPRDELASKVRDVLDGKQPTASAEARALTLRSRPAPGDPGSGSPPSRPTIPRAWEGA